MYYTIFAAKGDCRYIIGLDGNIDHAGQVYDRANVLAMGLKDLRQWDKVWAVAYDDDACEIDNILIKVNANVRAKKDKQVVYLVCQTQPAEKYIHTTIYVLSDYRAACLYCQKLNRQFAQNVDLDEQGNFISVKDGALYDDIHYYRVRTMVVDENLVL